MTRKKSLSEILADNVARAMEADPDIETQTKLAGRSGGAFGQQHVGRILKGELSVGLDVLEGLAKAIRCEPWELLVDGEAAQQAAWERIIKRPRNNNEPKNVVPITGRRRRQH